MNEECVNAQPENPRKNFTRRAFGTILAFLPLALLISSLAIGIIKGQQSNFAGVGFMIGAAVIAALNCYLSFVRPYLFHVRHGSMEGYRNVSGIPIIGTVLVFLGIVFGFGAIGSNRNCGICVGHWRLRLVRYFYVARPISLGCAMKQFTALLLHCSISA